MQKHWFDDYRDGETAEFGDYEMTETEIIAFARNYDPQPFHVDREAGAASIHGGLIASGWHTCAVMMRMIADHWLPQESSLGSPGIDELRWIKPVRPGDRLHVRVTVREARRSATRTDRGLVRSFVEVLDQNGEVAMSLVAVNFFLLRPAT
jgi:acyl dehydratase